MKKLEKFCPTVFVISSQLGHFEARPVAVVIEDSYCGERIDTPCILRRAMQMDGSDQGSCVKPQLKAPMVAALTLRYEALSTRHGKSDGEVDGRLCS
jgi:hypothetical protein